MNEYTGYIAIKRLDKNFELAFWDHRRRYTGDHKILTHKFKEGETFFVKILDKEDVQLFVGNIYVQKMTKDYCRVIEVESGKNIDLDCSSRLGHRILIQSKYPLFNETEVIRGEAAYQREIRLLRENCENKKVYIEKTRMVATQMTKEELVEFAINVSNDTYLEHQKNEADVFDTFKSKKV